jgi:hypothetical protein
MVGKKTGLTRALGENLAKQSRILLYNPLTDILWKKLYSLNMLWKLFRLSKNTFDFSAISAANLSVQVVPNQGLSLACQSR